MFGNTVPLTRAPTLVAAPPRTPQVKNVTDDFSAVAEDPRFRFVGNLRLGDPGHSGASGEPGRAPADEAARVGGSPTSRRQILFSSCFAPHGAP